MEQNNTTEKPDFCLYLKFYETKIKYISNWKNIIEEIINKKICPIYIWIESVKSVQDLNLKYKDNINYITHINKSSYNKDILSLERKITAFMKDVGFKNQLEHCQAHLKSFLLPKEEYVIHLDGDDMFYSKLTVNDLLNGIKYVKENNLEIISRPYWITVNRGWSFGFVIQKRNLINKMFILDYENLSNEYKKDNFIKNNIDIAKVLNLDNYFGMILIKHYNYSYNKLFFYFNSFPYWADCENNDQKFITSEVTKNFCLHFDIKGI